MKKTVILILAGIALVSFRDLSPAMMCHSEHGEHSQHEEKAKEEPKAKSSVKESFYQTVYVCPMHPEVREEKSGKCPKCGMKLEKKQILMAYVCPEPQCAYQKASPGECPEHKKELVKVELKTHCPKCGERVEAAELKLKPIKEVK